jgi:tetratricopeptide (TPR) repeat protein
MKVCLFIGCFMALPLLFAYGGPTTTEEKPTRTHEPSHLPTVPFSTVASTESPSNQLSPPPTVPFSTVSTAGSPSSTDTAGLHFDAGLELQEDGRLEEAISEFDEAIRLSPVFAGACNERGITYSKLGFPSLAILDYGDAIRFDPQFAEALTNRGREFSGLGQYDRAIQDLDEAIRVEPELPSALLNRGIV